MSGAHPASSPDERQARAAERTIGLTREGLSLNKLALMLTALLGIPAILGYCSDRADERTKHASQVSWSNRWSEYQLVVRNSSTATISQVAMRYRASPHRFGAGGLEGQPLHEGWPTIELATIPPCTIVVIDASALEDYYLGPEPDRPGPSGIGSIVWARVDFTDEHGRWAVTEDGQLESIDRDERFFTFVEGVPDFTHLAEMEGWIDEEPAENCGSN